MGVHDDKVYIACGTPFMVDLIQSGQSLDSNHQANEGGLEPPDVVQV